MAKKPLPSPELLRQLLRYEPETGKLFWRERSASLFSTTGRVASWAHKIWNSQHAHKECFLSKNRGGYKKGSIQGTTLRAHRVIWAMENGRWPRYDIDHINRKRDDNRIVNLREVTRSENHLNTGMRSNNTSGHKGVFFCATKKVWIAEIYVNKNRNTLGRYKNKEDAIKARKEAENEINYLGQSSS